MANQVQVERLKQGVEGWNKWREKNPKEIIDLEGVNLWETGFNGNYLGGDNFNPSSVLGPDLRKANLSRANLRGANLGRILLTGAQLGGALLREADLRGAYLAEVNFGGADLSGANLSKANLSNANIRGAGLREGNLTAAEVQETDFGNIDLSKTKGLDEVRHHGPSIIDLDTLKLSKGKIPEAFLRGCGLSDVDIEFAKLANPTLSNEEINTIVYRIYDLRATRAIQINPLFISYSHSNNAFVDMLEKYLDNYGIRFWRDIHDAIAGRLEKVVDRAMRLNPTVLLVLSGDSVMSDWVEHEARLARELGKELRRDVLCPVALDDAWKNCKWPARLREQIMEYNILDFSKWQDEGEFGKMFRKLIDGLDLFYKEK